MSKYIDAEKLIAEIKRYKNKADERLKIKGRTFSEEQKDLALQNLCGNLLYFISSHQQEQPEISNSLVDVDAVREDFMAKVYHILDADPTNDRANAIISVFDSLPTVCQEQPEYGYITTKYIPGQKPRWKVGDILAYYINNSDEEGEDVLGKVVKIRPDEIGGWLYTFENEDVWDEESLIREGAYGK